MDHASRRNSGNARAAEEAIEWLERQKQQRPGDNAAFLEWLSESRAHVRELLLASAWDVALRRVDSAREMDVQKLLAAASTNVLPVGKRTTNANAHPQRLRRMPWLDMRVAVAAGAFILVATLGLWGLWSLPEKYATSVGEQRTVELADGSIISLSAQTTVNVELSRSARELYLRDGQAMFAVAHDAARPFRVHAGTAVVQAIGTKFDVRRIGNRAHVAVIEGEVLITSDKGAKENSAGSENIVLAAGQAVSIGSRGIAAPAAVEIADVTAWQQRRLKFRYSTLEEVVHEFNRFNRTPRIRIEGARLRARPISGVFEADDPESLIASLASKDDIAVERSGTGVVIREK